MGALPAGGAFGGPVVPPATVIGGIEEGATASRPLVLPRADREPEDDESTGGRFRWEWRTGRLVRQVARLLSPDPRPDAAPADDLLGSWVADNGATLELGADGTGMSNGIAIGYEVDGDRIVLRMGDESAASGFEVTPESLILRDDGGQTLRMTRPDAGYRLLAEIVADDVELWLDGR